MTEKQQENDKQNTKYTDVRNASVTFGVPSCINTRLLLFLGIYDILKRHNPESKMQTFHILDWYVNSYRPFNTATPLCNACTDYGLLDQILLHSISNSSCKMKGSIRSLQCKNFSSEAFQEWTSTQQMFGAKASISLTDPDVLKHFNANWNWNDNGT